jgi:pimeloyl-ACP methyl ester carboxylesterase
MPTISAHTTEIDGLPIFWRSAPAPADTGGAPGEPSAALPADAAALPADSQPADPKLADPKLADPQLATTGPAGAAAPSLAGAVAPTLYLHGVPTNSDDWLPFLPHTGGFAPDLPGFGRSGKPGYLRYTIDEYADFIERFLDHLEIERVRMVVHDWGAVGLAFAQRHPRRVQRLVVMNAVTFLPGYRWHRAARLWRTPVLGELFMGATTRRLLRRAMSQATTRPPIPETFLDTVLDHFDQGTQRAILRLYRSSPSDVLAQAGAHLDTLTMPALVVWGERDPYIATSFARAYADALHAQLLSLPDAGHWWWLDRPDAIPQVADFLTAV